MKRKSNTWVTKSECYEGREKLNLLIKIGKKKKKTVPEVKFSSKGLSFKTKSFLTSQKSNYRSLAHP